MRLKDEFPGLKFIAMPGGRYLVKCSCYEADERGGFRVKFPAESLAEVHAWARSHEHRFATLEEAQAAYREADDKRRAWERELVAMVERGEARWAD